MFIILCVSSLSSTKFTILKEYLKSSERLKKYRRWLGKFTGKVRSSITQRYLEEKTPKKCFSRSGIIRIKDILKKERQKKCDVFELVTSVAERASKQVAQGKCQLGT